MTSKAEAALAGKRFPFTCSREFWKSNENDEINFYLKHSSMVSSFYVSDEKHTTFGLEDAVEWFKNREKYTSPDPANVRLELKDINEGNFFLTDTEMEDIRARLKTMRCLQSNIKILRILRIRLHWNSGKNGMK